MTKVSIAMCYRDAWWSFLGRFIMRAEGKPYSHFATITHLEFNDRFAKRAYEAVWPESHSVPFVEWSAKYRVVRTVTLLVDASQNDITAWLNSYTGRPYSLWQLILIYLNLSFKRINQVTGKVILNHDKELICTEHTGLFLEKFFKIVFTESEDVWSLDDIERVLLQIEEHQRKEI
jgi:hypothetical protein